MLGITHTTIQKEFPSYKAMRYNLTKLVYKNSPIPFWKITKDLKFEVLNKK